MSHKCTESVEVWLSYTRIVHQQVTYSHKRWLQLIHRCNRAQGTPTGNFFDYFDL